MQTVSFFHPFVSSLETGSMSFKDVRETFCKQEYPLPKFQGLRQSDILYPRLFLFMRQLAHNIRPEVIPAFLFTGVPNDGQVERLFSGDDLPMTFIDSAQFRRKRRADDSAHDSADDSDGGAANYFEVDRKLDQSKEGFAFQRREAIVSLSSSSESLVDNLFDLGDPFVSTGNNIEMDDKNSEGLEYLSVGPNASYLSKSLVDMHWLAFVRPYADYIALSVDLEDIDLEAFETCLMNHKEMILNHVSSHFMICSGASEGDGKLDIKCPHGHFRVFCMICGSTNVLFCEHQTLIDIDSVYREVRTTSRHFCFVLFAR